MNDRAYIKEGYFLIARKIFESSVWFDNPHVLKMFIWFIGKARHKKNPKKYPHCTIQRGELVTSLSEISENNEWMEQKAVRKWSRQKVSRMIKTLEDQGLIKVIADTYGTHIKVCNYDIYQDWDRYKADNHGTTPDNHGTTPGINNDGNDGNDGNKKRGKKRTVFTPPSLQEVRDYVKDQNYHVDPENFMDFYTSKNWYVGKNKMKDWKAALRTWERRRKETPGKANSRSDWQDLQEQFF